MPPAAMGGIFVLPTRIAPAALNFAAMPESSFEARPARAGEPFVTVRLATL